MCLNFFHNYGVDNRFANFHCQYIDNEVLLESSEISKKANSYAINIADDYSSNYKIINGQKIFIDFGAMEVKHINK